VSLEIVNEVVEGGDYLLRIDDLELGELADVLPVAVFFIRHNKGSAGVLLHLIILKKQTLIDHLGHVLKGLVNDSGNAAQVRRDQVVLLTILKNVPHQQFAVLLVVQLLELLCQLVRVCHVLAPIQPLLELLVFSLA
jgi:hypothetical protein